MNKKKRKYEKMVYALRGRSTRLHLAKIGLKLAAQPEDRAEYIEVSE